MDCFKSTRWHKWWFHAGFGIEHKLNINVFTHLMRWFSPLSQRTHFPTSQWTNRLRTTGWLTLLFTCKKVTHDVMWHIDSTPATSPFPSSDHSSPLVHPLLGDIPALHLECQPSGVQGEKGAGPDLCEETRGLRFFIPQTRSIIWNLLAFGHRSWSDRPEITDSKESVRCITPGF